MNRKKVIGIVIFLALILVVVGIKYFSDETGDINLGGLTTVYVATGGGKEGFLVDEDVVKILRKKYKLNVVFDSWSNGKTIVNPLIREYIGLGNESVVNAISNGSSEYTVHSNDVSKYDALFTSDQRFYDYYKLWPDKEKGEADRYNVLGGNLTLNTPIVIYSWQKIVDAFMAEGIVTENDGVYYISDMNKLMQYILDGKKWSDVGLT